MYGSIHTHFESLDDTDNNDNDKDSKLIGMLREFDKVGAKKVAVTEHGEFTSFEDLRSFILDTNNDKKEPDINVRVIPGIEGYLGENKRHIILIAKDKEGYRELSNIISDSAVNHDNYGTSIITYDILRKYVKPSHIIFSSACIQGVFGEIFTDIEKEKQQKIDNYEHRLDVIGRDKIAKADDTFTKWHKLSKAECSEIKKDKDRYEDISNDLHIHQSVSNIRTKIQKLKENDTVNPSEEERDKKAFSIYNELVDIFGPDDVYLEIQNHGIDKEQDIYGGLIRFARRHHLTDHLIASNDIHIGKTEPSEIDFLKRRVANFNRYKAVHPLEEWEKELYIKDDDKLKEALMGINGITEEEVDTAISNIENCLSKCETKYLYEDKNEEKHYPVFSKNEDELFDRLVDEGIHTKFPNGFPTEEYQRRLKHEKEVIHKMGYCGYHLIVQDYIDYGRNLGYLNEDEIDSAPDDLEKLKEITKHRPHNAFPIGAGRGSAVGSLCCYLLGITDIDPIPYGLLFERFLNPERVSMPDIDTDFSPKIRNKCIEYCKVKYGHTAKIMTKQYAAIKGAIDLAGRFIGNEKIDNEYEGALLTEDEKKQKMSKYMDMIRHLSSMVTELRDDEGKVTQETGIDKKEYETLSNEEKEIYDLAVNLRGMLTGYGQHACGNIISGDYIPDILPIKYNKSNDTYETTCNMGVAESKGMLKMDFLGLENLDIVTDLIRLTGDAQILDYNKRQDLLKDKKVFKEIFDKGLTQGVFQFESDGMKKLMRDFRPDTFEDLILLNAAYRPGPMQFLQEIIEEKQYEDGRKPTPPEKRSISIDNEKLQSILKSTYGCIIYQEQVMKICTDLAGFTMGHADNVRKYMSKKKADKLAHERDAFVQGCKKTSGISEEEADHLFDQMMDFAAYAFNKSHATAYTLLAFFTAYYKAYYPDKFYAVSLNHMKEQKELPPFRNEMKQLGVSCEPPRVGISKTNFTADRGKVYYGISSIKGVKKDTKILNAESLPTLFLRNRHLSEKALIPLAYAGVLDKYGNRADVIGYIIDYHDKIINKEKAENDIDFINSDICDYTDKKKAAALRGANKRLENIGEIPSFDDYCNNDMNKHHITDEELREKEYELLSTIFLTRDEAKLLEQYGEITNLPEKGEHRMYYLFNCKPVTSKKGWKAYKAEIMDGQYNVIERFVNSMHKNGIYESFIDDNPFTLKNQDEDNKIKAVDVKKEVSKERRLRITCTAPVVKDEIKDYILKNLPRKKAGTKIDISFPDMKNVNQTNHICTTFYVSDADKEALKEYLNQQKYKEEIKIDEYNIYEH